MARLDATWLNFTARGQTWDHFWQDSASADQDPEPTVALDDDNDAAFVLRFQTTSDEETVLIYAYGWMYA